MSTFSSLSVTITKIPKSDSDWLQILKAFEERCGSTDRERAIASTSNVCSVFGVVSRPVKHGISSTAIQCQVKLYSASRLSPEHFSSVDGLSSPLIITEPMFPPRETEVVPQHTHQRRSFSHNVRTSFDNATSKLSFSHKSDRPARRSISGPRSASSLSNRQESSMLDPEASLFASYMLGSSAGTVSENGEDSDIGQPLASPLERSDTAQKSESSEQEWRLGREGRSKSVLSTREDSMTSISSTSSKWYKRLHRAGSANRLSKAMDTAEAANNQPTGKLYNPFSRRRSIPVLAARPIRTILGQTATQAIDIGGHSANASALLPREILPSQSIELPYMVDACITWLIENHAYMIPGIFRVNGSSQAIRTIIEHFSTGCLRMPLEDIILPAKQLVSVHDVASCLKKFLVLLPGGLLGEQVFEQLKTIVGSGDKLVPEVIGKEISVVLRTISEEPRYNTLIVLLAFLCHISRQVPSTTSETAPKQESGHMNAFSLGIVFSPTCLGSRDGATDMVRSATSQSEQSVQSESTPIEEAVAVARAGAKVMQWLISSWPEISKHLSDSPSNVSLNKDDDVSLLDVVSFRLDSDETEPRNQLHTIVDSPVKPRQHGTRTHDRSESNVTVTMKGKENDDESVLMLRDAQIDLLKARIKQAEIERDDAITNLRQQESENAKLFTRNLLLERENKTLRTKKWTS